MAFQGSLEELPLPDVIQLVAASGKTGKFLIETKLGSGEIFLTGGTIVHAQSGSTQGEEAFYELATWQEGTFRFEPGIESPRKTVEKSNTNLLMAAAQRIDEWKVLISRVPSTRMVPVFTEEGGKTPVSLTPREWEVVRKINEARTIDDIGRELGLSPFEVSKTVYGLITSGLVRLNDEDLDKSPFDRLRRMSPEGLRALAQDIQQATNGLLGKGDNSLGEAPFQEATQQIDAGLGAEAVMRMIRSQERTIASTYGPNQAQAFLASVGRLIDGQ